MTTDPPPPAVTPVRRNPLRWLPVVCVILGLPVAIFAAVLFAYRHYVTPAADTPAARRLAQVGAALHKFADAHGGGYPDDLSVLVRDGTLTSAQLAGPADDGVAGGPFPYVYLGRGLGERTATNGTVIAHDDPRCHADGGAEVLYADGSVARLDQRDLTAELARPSPSTPANDGAR